MTQKEQELVKQIEGLRADLLETDKYMRHDPECSVLVDKDKRMACTCGLWDLQKRVAQKWQVL